MPKMLDYDYLNMNEDTLVYHKNYKTQKNKNFGFNDLMLKPILGLSHRDRIVKLSNKVSFETK